jgi:rhodanese-related sulfurtransferase
MSQLSPSKVNEVRSTPEVILLDVRTPAEVRTCQIEGCQKTPLDKLSNCPDIAKMDRDSRIILVCGSGQRAEKARGILVEKGFKELSILEGGMTAWEKENLPVVRGKETMSLERQVRIAAGFMVALGTALGVWVDPAWLALPAFVGCGLVFAGITNTCGMGMMIAKLPWNR